MLTRRVIVVLAAGHFSPFASFAQQQPNRVYRIGFLGTGSASGWVRNVEAFRDGLRELGYVEGKNVVIEYRWGDGKYERLPELAAELVRLEVDVLVSYGTPGIRAAKQATTKIPIVMATSGDAVATGLIATLARPGGNVTGSTFFDPELSAKRLELLKEAIPRAKRVATLLNPANPQTRVALQSVEGAAKSLKMNLQRFEVQGANEFEAAFAAMGKSQVDAVWIQQDPMIFNDAKKVADLAGKHRLPAIGFSGYVEAGGLIDYGVDFPRLFRRAAYFIDKILKGAKPEDIPVEQPTVFELAINMNTAKALGIQIPYSLLLRATKVIE
jgi:putative tryptophan/tyrosine transport system substrate-binding protein